MAELEWEPVVYAVQIGVKVKDGIVTLAERDLGTSTAWGSPGVRNVIEKMSLAY